MSIAVTRVQLLTSFLGLKWYREELRKSPKADAVTLATRWHELMAPIRRSGNSPAASLSPGSEGRSEEGKETRSEFRRTMYHDLEQEAQRVCQLLAKDYPKVSYPSSMKASNFVHQ
jgi:hypothetical protein